MYYLDFESLIVMYLENDFASLFRAQENKYLTDRLGGKEAWRPTHFSYYQTFFCIFQTNLAMAPLGLKEMVKFLWEGREKGGKREGQG